jgi:transcriptional regulator with XRE-family HTH domain
MAPRSGADPFWHHAGKGLTYMKDERIYEMYAEPYTQEEWKQTGARIKVACKEAGYKLSDMARNLGLSPKSFYKITAGEIECKTGYLYEISQLTEVSVDYLLFGGERTEGFEDIIAICQDISIKDMERVRKVMLAFVD